MATASPLVDRLRGLLGRDGVLSAPSELIVYECGGIGLAGGACHAV